MVGAKVLDLFAGTGALGIEALSRGAASATFVDRDPEALRVVRANLETTGVGPARVVRADAGSFLQAGEPYDLALCDPPYDFAGWPELLGRLDASVVAVESDHEVAAPDGWRVLRSRRHGGTVVVLFAKAAAGGDSPSPLER